MVNNLACSVHKYAFVGVVWVMLWVPSINGVIKFLIRRAYYWWATFHVTLLPHRWWFPISSAHKYAFVWMWWYTTYGVDIIFEESGLISGEQLSMQCSQICLWGGVFFFIKSIPMIYVGDIIFYEYRRCTTCGELTVHCAVEFSINNFNATSVMVSW